MMHCLFLVLLLFSTALAEKCDLRELCKEETPKCWPDSEDELREFADQFTSFDNLKCVETVLLNKELFFGGGLEKRIRDLANYDGFKKMSAVLVRELYTHKETPEYLKMIPVAILCDGLDTKREFKHILELIEHQKYYYLGSGHTLYEFEVALLDPLENSKDEKASWLTNPTWIAFSDTYNIEPEYGNRVLTLLLEIGKEVEKTDTNDEIKTAFILTVVAVIDLFPLDDEDSDEDSDGNSFFERNELGPKTLDSLKSVIKSVKDGELSSVLEVVPWKHKNVFGEVYSNMNYERRFHSIKILWRSLKKIGHKNNAAKLILDNFKDILMCRYFAYNASKDNDGQEMFATFLNVIDRKYEFYNASDIVDMINGFESGKVPAKIKEREQLFRNTWRLKDFEYVYQSQSSALTTDINEGTGTEPVSIALLMDKNPKELRDSLYSLDYDKVVGLLILLSQFPALPKNVQVWLHSHSVCSALVKRLSSFKPPKYPFTSQYYDKLYFLLPYFSLDELELFKSQEGSLASAFLSLSELLQTQTQTLEWLFSVRRAVPVLFAFDEKITGQLIELFWTYRVILNEFVEKIESTEEEGVEKRKRDSHILKVFLQDFGSRAEIFDREDQESMPRKWTLFKEPFSSVRNTVILNLDSQPSDNSEKIPLAKVLEALIRHLDDKLKWEYITEYLRSMDLDFIKVKELADKMLHDVSKKSNWSTDQENFAKALFVCYNLDPVERLECHKEFTPISRSNVKVLSDLIPFTSALFLAWMPSAYENIKEFHSIVVRTDEGRSEQLEIEISNSLSSFENVLHSQPDILAEPTQFFVYSYELSSQYTQNSFKELLDEKLNLFKKTSTGSYIPAWAVSKETGKVIGRLLGKFIQSKAPFCVSLDPAFISLLLNPSNTENKRYYKTHYAEDFNEYSNTIKSLGEKGLQEGFDKLPIPEICNVRCTTMNSLSNLLSLDPVSQMKTVPTWDYLTTEYLDLINFRIESAFCEMVSEMRKGLLKSLNKEIWDRIHKIKDIEDLFKAEKN